MKHTSCIKTNLEVRFSPIDRFGVFAGEVIAQGTIIEESPCLVLERDWEKMNTVLNHYLFAWPKDGDGRAVVFGNASLLNHSPNPNVDWETDEAREVVVFKALRDIAQGEEILVDYTQDYWKVHDQYNQRSDVKEDTYLDRQCEIKADS